MSMWCGNELGCDYEALIQRAVAPFLRSKGFVRRRSTFRRLRNDVTHVMWIQKSQRSTREETVFCINIAVASNYLCEREQLIIGNISVDECHWKERVYRDRPTREEWWTLSAYSAEAVANSVMNAISADGLPILDRFESAQDLLAVWRTGEGPGLTEAERLLYFAILAEKIGPAGEAAALLSQLKQFEKPTAPMLMYLKEKGEI